MGTNTGLGIGIGIPFKNNALGGDKPYFPPELKARMIGVWTNYGKKNTDADRNIIKNKIPNAGGDLEILNAAYKLNSGFGKYSEDFTTWTKSSKITSVDSESFDFVTNVNWNLLYYKSNIGKDIPSFKVHIKLKGEGKVFYNYITSEGVFTNKVITSEEYVVPISYNTKYTGETPVNCGFSIGVTSEECSGTITQIPNFEDAFVTDGINDMIISQKTLQEMGVTKELTIVSMIHQISWRNSASIPLTNYIRNGDTFIRNSISNIGKTGIYGYTCFNIKNVNSSASKVINNILGDKNDYIVEYRGDILSKRFSVQGYIDANGNILETSSVAHYWTFAVLGKATEDEINLIIGNYNLDRSLKPDILCNIGKQGITNDNHAEFNDKLIDYSGNGRDIQMNNLAWKGGSGIAAKPFETIKDYTIISDKARQKLTIYNEFSYKIKSNTPSYYWTVQSIIRDNTSYQVTIITDKDCYWINSTSFINSEGNKESIRKRYPVLANTPTQVIICGLDQFEYPEGIEPTSAVSYVNLEYAGEITITFIPSHKGGLLLDGITDFGKVTGMPIYKDYTFIIDRQIISIGDTNGIVASKSEDSTDVNKQGAFLFEYLGAPNNISAWSFYKDNGKVANTDFTRGISYQSKYSYNGIELLAGTALDSDKLWLGILRNKDSRFANVAIYSLMSFPYSMSKFLIERQLKKHKLGTFYPNMVEFRPVIKANANYKITYYQIDSTNTWKLIKVGDYIVIGAKLAFQITFDNDASELKEVVSPQLSGIIVEKRPSNPGYNIYSYITSKSPQKINITIDEYIRYEDIVQPYPVVFQITDRNTNQRYSWGDKIKVGSSIQLTQGENPNLLSGLYSVQSYEYEGETYTYNQLKALVIIITKSGIQLSCNKVWAFDNNEPKCILSPRLLRIPNSSYKILGHIPDISGHGNHGKINNSAYALASGANGYPYDYNNSSFWSDSGLAKVVSGELIEYFAVKNSTGFSNITSGVYKGEIKVTGVTKAISENKISRLRIYTNSTTDNELIDITQDGNYNIDIKGVGDANRVFFYAIPNNPNESIVVRLTEPIYIEQVGEYEGAYCLDGVDDFVTIPTTVGGKQVLMKVNWQKSPTLLYDQRASGSFAVLTTKEDDAVSSRIAYQGRNPNGKTYIDGIENNNIETYTLKDITHNITIANSSLGGIIVPVIGCNTGKTSNFAQMTLYDFMLFDEISTEAKIKELNTYIGITPKVTLPNYYWDNYGKKNTDANRGHVDEQVSLQKTGTSVNPLENFNISYEGMSGYNGYPVVFGASKTWESLSGVYSYTSNVTNTTIHVTHTEHAGNSLLFSYTKKDGALANIKEIPAFRVTVRGLEGNSKFGYRYLATEDATEETLVYLGNGTHELAKSFAPTEVLLDLTRNVWVGIFITPMIEGEVVFDCDITIEVLPEYENGLAYDGVSDFSQNTEIEVVEDFTFLVKGSLLKGLTGSGGCIARKGDKKHYNTDGYAFIYCFDSPIESYRNSYYSFGKSFVPSKKIVAPPLIGYMTKTNVNGETTTFGTNSDIKGIIFGNWSSGYMNMVIYKSIFYTKTISLLEINFLKNLMEKDEIIDINHPIFISNTEDESNTSQDT